MKQRPRLTALLPTSPSRRLPDQRRISFGLPVAFMLLAVGWASAEVVWRGDFETGTTECQRRRESGGKAAV